jgi:branched-chain amino acid transport system permease protein
MARVLELIVAGLSLGGIYALLAFAMSLTISTTRVLNVAHGVFFVWGGAVFVILTHWLKLHPALSLAMFSVSIAGVSLAGSRIVILAFVLLMVGGFHLFLTKTFLGKGARAMAQNFDGFLVIGLNPMRLSLILFTLAIVATAVSGAFYVLAVPLNPYEGLPLTLKSLTVVILAGVGNLPATLVAGAVLGLAEVITSQVLGSVWAPAVSLAILFLVLVFRPTGMFGKGGY